MINLIKKLEYITFGFIFSLSILLIIFYLFFYQNFSYYQFGDRDLLRSLYLFDNFQLYGPELNHLNGLRSFGGFLYYYIYLIQQISSKIAYIFLISLIFNILCSCIFSLVIKKVFNIKIAILTLFLLLSSIPLFELLFRLWNPSFGFGFMLLSYSFAVLNFIKISRTNIFLFTLFGLISFQFHSTYILPMVCGYFFILSNSTNRIKDYLYMLFTFVFLSTILFSHSVFYFNEKNIEKYNFSQEDYNYRILNENDIVIISNETKKNVIEDKNIINNNDYFIIDNVLNYDSKIKILQKSILDNYYLTYKYFISKISNKMKLLFSYEEGWIYFNISVPVVILLLYSYLIYYKSPNHKLFNDVYWKRYVNFLYFLIILILITSLGFLLLYKRLEIGLSRRYFIVVAPILSVLIAFSCVSIYEYLKLKIKIFILLFFILLAFLKFIFAFDYLIDSYSAKFNHTHKNSVKKILINDLGLSSDEIHSRVLVGSYVNTKYEFLPSLTIDYALNNEKNTRDLSAENYINNFCYILVNVSEMKKNNNEKLLISNLDIINNREIIEIKQYDSFVLFKYKNNFPCYNNLSNDYVIKNNEIKVFKFLKKRKLNKLYEIIDKDKKLYFAKILLNKNYQPGLILNQKIDNIPLHLSFKAEYHKNYIYFSIASYQLRNNVNIGGSLAGYRFDNIKIDLIDKINKNILKSVEYKDLSFGKDPSTLKSPFNITIPLSIYNFNEIYLKVTFENINNNIEMSKMNNLNTIEFILENK